MRLDFVCSDPESQSLNVRDSVLTCVAVGHCARKVGKLSNPAAVLFLLNLNL